VVLRNGDKAPSAQVDFGDRQEQSSLEELAKKATSLFLFLF
jgi:hypothetical protein